MRLLLVFINEPIPGSVNTRMAADLDDERATLYYKAMAEVTLRQLQGLNDCRIRFCYSPDDARDAVAFWLLPKMKATSSDQPGVYLAPPCEADPRLSQEVDFRPQGSGNQGQRLSGAFAEGFAEGYDAIAAISSNCPECGARWINAAFSRLCSDPAKDAVLGPSSSGGYYFMAVKSHSPQLFSNIPWGGGEILSTTLSAAKCSGLNVELLPELTDLHTLADWEKTMGGPLGAAMKKALGEPLEGDQGLNNL